MHITQFTERKIIKIMRKRIGNDFLFYWIIKENNVIINPDAVIDFKIIIRHRRTGSEIVAEFDVVNSSPSIKCENLPYLGIYDLIATWKIVDATFIDGYRDCTADIQGFEIVTSSSLECETDLTVTSEIAIGFEGADAFEVWLKNGNEGKTYEDYIAFLQKPATDVAALANNAATLANEKAVLAQSEADNANAKAGLADAASVLATDKAGLADSKATLANEKAALAQSAADNANAKAAEVTAAVLSVGQLGPIKPTDAAPTPARNGNYTFSIGGTKPAWLTAEAGVTTVKAGDGVSVVYTEPSSYTYTHVDTGNYMTNITEDLFSAEKAAIAAINQNYVFKGFLRAGTDVSVYSNYDVYTSSEDLVFNTIELKAGERVLRFNGWVKLPTTYSAHIINESETKKFVTSNQLSDFISKNDGNNIFLVTSGTAFDNARKIEKAIISILYQGSYNIGYKYSIGVFSNNSTYRRIRLFQYNGTASTEVCNLTVSQSSARTAIEEVVVPSFNSSGVTAKVLVDWSKLQNVDMYGSYYYDLWYSSYKCFSEVYYNNYLKTVVIKKTENLISGVEQLTLTNWTLTNGAVQSQATGWTNYAFYNKNLNEDKFSLSAKLKATNTGDFEVGIGKRADTSGTAVTLRKNATGSYLCFWKMSNYANPTEEISLRQTLPTALENNKEYLLKMTKSVNQLSIQIIYESGTVFEYSINYFGYFSWGYPSLYCITGQCEASEFYFSMPYKRNPKLLIFGDSFIEGNSISATKELRYAALLTNDLGTDECLLLGKGGESTTSILNRIYTQIDWYADAKYCLIALGTNDGVFSTYQTNMNAIIAYLKLRNITPILVTVTYRSDSDNSAFIAQANPWVRSLGELYIDMCLAVTEPGSETVWRSGFQLGDGVHPSILGHEHMYNRIKFDAQYLFK